MDCAKFNHLLQNRGSAAGMSFASDQASGLEVGMATRKLERSEWRQYFDGVAKHLPSMRVGISILGQQSGVQVENDNSALLGISYDPKDDAFEVATPSISHRISHPEEIFVREQGGQLSSVEVVDQDGNKEIIELRALPSLPAS
jgi:hypothetical protein